jgi:hypothetical protein
MPGAPRFDSPLFDSPLFDSPMFDSPMFDSPLFDSHSMLKLVVSPPRHAIQLCVAWVENDEWMNGFSESRHGAPECGCTKMRYGFGSEDAV